METQTNNTTSLNGGEWLIKESNAHDIFIPEEFSEEQKMIMDMSRQFIRNEVVPVLDRIDAQEPGLMRSLFKKTGDLGMLGASVPEEYGGMGKDLVTSTIIAESFGWGHSFCVSFIAHTGIGTLPILHFGTEEQRKKFVPKLASGEWVGAYGLTEPGSGSDALSAKTTAKLSDDKKY